ncbi:MAG TPA: hypothetical protein VMW47_12115 [Verrucomicrobiae bacterium]|nr:hypothetical protein [Verrucomicrobiae bacterium]
MRGFKIANADLGERLLAARQAVQDLEAELEATPSRPPLNEVAPGTQLLDAESKLVTHGVRMSAYNGESAPARLLVPHYRRAEEEGRVLLRETVRTSGSLEVVGLTCRAVSTSCRRPAAPAPGPPSATSSTGPSSATPAPT